MKKIMTPYQIGGKDFVETTSWKPVGLGNPQGVALPGEVGLWKIIGVSSPARDIDGLSAPSMETFQQTMVDDDGNVTIADVPTSVDMHPDYWDYFNLPLRPGVVLT